MICRNTHYDNHYMYVDSRYMYDDNHDIYDDIPLHVWWHATLCMMITIACMMITITCMMITTTCAMITVACMMITMTYTMICHYMYDDTPHHARWYAIAYMMIAITYTMISFTYTMISFTYTMISFTYTMIWQYKTEILYMTDDRFHGVWIKVKTLITRLSRNLHRSQI